MKIGSHKEGLPEDRSTRAYHLYAHCSTHSRVTPKRLETGVEPVKTEVSVVYRYPRRPDSIVLVWGTPQERGNSRYGTLAL